MTLFADQHFVPRRYQCDGLRVLARGAVKREYDLWHRRAGKDKKSFVFMGDRAARHRVGNYFYVFPKYVQGREAMWKNVDADGFRTIDHVPAPLVAGTNEADMRIDFRNGSTIQIVGADRREQIDRHRSANAVGVVFSEWSRMNPYAWDVFRPMLSANGGWAIFNTTPNGPNHAKKMWDMACVNPAWFAQKITVEDSDITGMLEAIEEEKIELRGQGWPAAEIEEYVQREYYCSFTAPAAGTIYGHLIVEAEKDGRVGRVPYNPSEPVHTCWDLGYHDYTAIWFVQRARGGALHAIDYLEGSGAGLQYYLRVVKERGYVYGAHVAPPDIKVHEYSAGEDPKTREQTAEALGVRFETAPNQSIREQIDATRNLIPRMFFDEEKCAAGLDALRSYHYEKDEARRIFKKLPEHDWSSHACSALAQFAITDPRAPVKRVTAAAIVTGAYERGGGGRWMGG